MSSPIVIVEKDRSLKLLYQAILTELKLRNQVLYFDSAREALDAMDKLVEKPFLVISNYDLPRVNGLDLKQKMSTSPSLGREVIPFILIASRPSKEIINRAHQLGVDGFFDRNTDYENLKFNFKSIIDNCVERHTHNWMPRSMPSPMALQYK